MKSLFIAFLVLHTAYVPSTAFWIPLYWNPDGIPFNPFTQKCCNGSVVHHGHDYVQCCGNSTFDIIEEICCDGVSQKLLHGSASRCCGSQQYDIKKELCCYNTVVSLPDDSQNKIFKCCGIEPMEITSNICCEDNIVPVTGSPFLVSCCGNLTYDVVEEICCYPETSVIKASDSIDACCNGQGYDTSKNLCCPDDFSDTVGRTLKPKLSNSMFCCGNDTFDANFQGCCNGNVINSHQFCCRDADGKTSIVLKNHLDDNACCDRETYCYDSSICCNGVVFDLPESEKESTDFKCCGDFPYNVRTHTCCPHEKLSSSPSIVEGKWCCGDKGYNFITHICCGKTLYPSENKLWQFCCGETLYDFRKENCCGGQLTPLSEGLFGCCAKPTDSHSEGYSKDAYKIKE